MKPKRKPVSPQKSNKFSRKDNYRVSSKQSSKTIVWIYNQAKNHDFWFVDVEWKEKWYFVYPKNMNGALDWDQVEATLQTFNRREEAIITKVLKRADRILVGTFQKVKSFWFVVLSNPAFRFDVYITADKLQKYKHILKDGDQVAIKITQWSWKNPEGRIIEVLWNKQQPWVDIMWLALEAGARLTFPENVLQQVQNMQFQEWENRRDLRWVLTFTIDGDDAKDLDDAISLKKITTKTWYQYQLIVSIADVAEYVQESTPLDKEALKRGNSIYLVDRVIPMLPEKLSNDLCSLNPHTQKLTLSCEILLDEQGNILSKKVFESIIESNFRLTYREVQELLDWKILCGDTLKFWWVITQELYDAVQNAYELKTKIFEKKKQAWILEFDFPETKIVLDEIWNPIDIQKYERYESMKIIEEFMILANQSVWELYSLHPFLYRIHALPDEDDIETLRKTLNIFGISFPYKQVTPKIIAEVLLQIQWNSKEKLLQKLVLRSLQKAIYSDENVWHFWLNLEYYSHFTSPIRRYPDLQIHRIIKEKIHKKLSNDRQEHYQTVLSWVAKHTSQTELKAEKLEYAVRDLMICKYYQDKIGLQVQAIVSWMVPGGIFIELDNTVEGFIEIEQIEKSLNLKLKDYIQEDMKFVFSWWQFLQVWDKIEGVLNHIDEERRRLYFNFISKI